MCSISGNCQIDALKSGSVARIQALFKATNGHLVSGNHTRGAGEGEEGREGGRRKGGERRKREHHSFFLQESERLASSVAHALQLMFYQLELKGERLETEEEEKPETAPLANSVSTLSLPPPSHIPSSPSHLLLIVC